MNKVKLNKPKKKLKELYLLLKKLKNYMIEWVKKMKSKIWRQKENLMS